MGAPPPRGTTALTTQKAAILPLLIMTACPLRNGSLRFVTHWLATRKACWVAPKKTDFPTTVTPPLIRSPAIMQNGGSAALLAGTVTSRRITLPCLARFSSTSAALTNRFPLHTKTANLSPLGRSRPRSRMDAGCRCPPSPRVHFGELSSPAVPLRIRCGGFPSRPPPEKTATEPPISGAWIPLRLARPAFPECSREPFPATGSAARGSAGGLPGRSLCPPVEYNDWIVSAFAMAQALSIVLALILSLLFILSFVGFGTLARVIIPGPQHPAEPFAICLSILVGAALFTWFFGWMIYFHQFTPFRAAVLLVLGAVAGVRCLHGYTQEKGCRLPRGPLAWATIGLCGILLLVCGYSPTRFQPQR